MSKFDFTKDEYEMMRDKLMLNDELSTILKMKIQGCSIVEMSIKLNISEATVSRRISEIKKKIKKII